MRSTWRFTATGAGHATGFVVDAKRGLILTNRHVVSTGPLRAEATFLNKEEVGGDAARRLARVSPTVLRARARRARLLVAGEAVAIVPRPGARFWIFSL